LAGLAAASLQGVAALGAAAGQRAQRFGRIAAATDASPLAACQARQDGFDLRAALRVHAGRRERLERMCRYVLRPPMAQDRVTVTSEGQVRLALRHAWSDGTTHLVFDPVAFLERLAVLVPRPRVNLILLSRRAGAAGAGAVGDRAACACAGGRWARAGRRRLAVGGADAPGVRVRRARVWVRGAAAPDRADRAGRRLCAHPAAPRRAGRGARGTGATRAAAGVRRGRSVGVWLPRVRFIDATGQPNIAVRQVRMAVRSASV
jgi:hypothetical protein